MRISTPYKNLMPEPSLEETLKFNEDVAKHGVREPIILSNDGKVLAGHRRYAADPKASSQVIDTTGWTEGQLQAYVLKSEDLKRQLDARGHAHVQQSRIAVAKLLIAEGKTREEIGELMGLERRRVGELMEIIRAADGTDNDLPPKRRRLSKEKIAELIRLHLEGCTQQEIAAKLGTSQPTVNRILEIIRLYLEGGWLPQQIADKTKSSQKMVDEVLGSLKQLQDEDDDEDQDEDESEEEDQDREDREGEDEDEDEDKDDQNAGRSLHDELAKAIDPIQQVIEQLESTGFDIREDLTKCHREKFQLFAEVESLQECVRLQTARISDFTSSIQRR